MQKIYIAIPVVYLIFPKSYAIIQIKSEQERSQDELCNKNYYERSYPK